MNTLNYALGNNAHDKSMFYTDLSLEVDDLLRGQIDKTVPFAQNGYLSFDPNFIEYTIQKHLELRALTIDAIGE